MVRSTLLQVSIGRQTAPRGGPPVDAPGPLLDHDISGSRSSNETTRVWIRIFFDDLSDGINAISPSYREVLRPRAVLAQDVKMIKSMTIQSIDDASGSIHETLDVSWKVP